MKQNGYYLIIYLISLVGLNVAICNVSMVNHKLQLNLMNLYAVDDTFDIDWYIDDIDIINSTKTS